MTGLLSLENLPRLAISITPVLVFLFVLTMLDTYRLVRMKNILRAILAGCAAALVCYFLNIAILRALGPYARWYAWLGLPLVEEIAKAAYLLWLIRTNRVGFMVDAAISGFAIGAGFALVENIYFIERFGGGSLVTWAIRGFGTAMMHGGTTAIVGIIATRMVEHGGSRLLANSMPGLLLAAAIHAFYNSSLVSPIVGSAAVLLGLPVLIWLIFERSEKNLRDWVGEKLDKDIDLLHMMTTGAFIDSPAGRYLRGLQETFPFETVCDMLCYLQLSLELSARAKGDLLRKEIGFPVEPDPEVASQFKEMAFLEHSIGPVGKRALAPLLPRSSRDLWELKQLSESAG
jgi:protease PrsW